MTKKEAFKTVYDLCEFAICDTNGGDEDWEAVKIVMSYAPKEVYCDWCGKEIFSSKYHSCVSLAEEKRGNTNCADNNHN